MLRSQTLQIEANDINTKLIALRAKLRDGNVEMRADDGTETEAYKAWQTETSGLEDNLKATLSRQHEAFESEDREIEARRDAGDTGGWDSEQREFIKIESRASMADYLARSLSDHEGQLRGPTAELDQALRGAEAITYDNIIPWALMLEPEKLKEVRALGTPSSVQGMQDPIIREVFAASTAAFLGTRYSSVGIGDALVPVLTAAAAAIEPKDDLIAAGGSIAVTTLTPKRFAVRYEIARQDMMRVRGLEATVRADMLPSVMNQLDRATIRGGANSVTGGILNAVSAQTVQGTLATWATGLERFAEAIDGRFARSLNQLKSVVGTELMARLYGLVASNTAVPLATFLMRESGGLMCTSNMLNTATNRPVLICKSGPGMMYNGVGKMWGGGMQVIRDEKTASAKDEVAITGSAYYDYSVVRTAGFRHTDVNVA